MKKALLIIVLLFGLHHVIYDGTIGVGVFTASAQQMANEFNEYDDDYNGGGGSTINGGELRNTDVWGNQPDNFVDILDSYNDIVNYLNNGGADNSDSDVPSTSEDYGGGGRSGTSNYDSYKIKSDDITLYNVVLPESWERQNKPTTCVPTSMEYVADLLNTYETYSRDDFARDYCTKIRYGHSFDKKGGVIYTTLDSYIRYEFDVGLIGSSLGADIAISSGYPLLADLTINHDNTYVNGEHEIVVVGYTAETHQYIYIDPATGTYKLTNFFDLNRNPLYFVKERKKNE